MSYQIKNCPNCKGIMINKTEDNFTSETRNMYFCTQCRLAERHNRK